MRAALAGKDGGRGDVALVFRTYLCPDCDRRFELLQERGDGPPRFCVNCGVDFGDEELEPVPAKVAIGGSAIARATDGTYRALEESSAARAQALDAPYLKITDMNDRQREGDVAAKVPMNVVTNFAQEAKNNIGVNYMGWGGGMAGARVAPAMPGPAAGASFTGPGHIALSAIQPKHQGEVQNNVAHPMAKPYVRG
jgi:hypothetical protein